MTVSALDLLFYAGALVILFLTPGPVWVAMGARALSGGFQAAWPLAVGVAIGDLVWPLLAVFGLAWVLTVYGDLMIVLRWVAARGGVRRRGCGHSGQSEGDPVLHGCLAGVL